MKSPLFQRPLPQRSLRVVHSSLSPQRRNTVAPSSRRGTLWYALCLPQLSTDTLGTVPRERLQTLAQALDCLSPVVSIQGAGQLVFEVGSTLRYFGGIRQIRRRLHAIVIPLLQAWGLPTDIQEAVSPTPAASLLLSSAACGLAIRHRDELRNALGPLPLHCLPLQEKQLRRFHRAGLRYLRDIWRLPSHEIGRRFGRDFLLYLDRCLGNVAMPVLPCKKPPHFSSHMDSGYAVENTQALQPCIEQLLQQLCKFLHQHELAAAHLHLVLHHERQQPTGLHLDMRRPSRDPVHLSLLLKNRLDSLALQAPVTGMTLKVHEFSPFLPHMTSLAGIQEALQNPERESDILPLLEQLQARLGNPAVRSIHCRNSHCPEQAAEDLAFGEDRKAPRLANTQALNKPGASRPCWLLPQPVALLLEEGRLYYQGSLHLLSGPERVETQWWTQNEIRRDYYVARNRHGMRLWIYHERESQNTQKWFLHGIFD